MTAIIVPDLPGYEAVLKLLIHATREQIRVDKIAVPRKTLHYWGRSLKLNMAILDVIKLGEPMMYRVGTFMGHALVVSPDEKIQIHGWVYGHKQTAKRVVKAKVEAKL